MTPIQRRACLALSPISVAYGRAQFSRRFGHCMQRRAESPRWEWIELTPRQLHRLATNLRRYRRQIRNQDLLFWAQRTLAELSQIEEIPCPK